MITKRPELTHQIGWVVVNPDTGKVSYYLTWEEALKANAESGGHLMSSEFYKHSYKE